RYAITSSAVSGSVVMPYPIGCHARESGHPVTTDGSSLLDCPGLRPAEGVPDAEASIKGSGPRASQPGNDKGNLEPVLALPDLAEDFPKWLALHAEPLLDVGARRAQERIGDKLFADRRGQSGLALLGQRRRLRRARSERIVLRLDGEREAAILVGI